MTATAGSGDHSRKAFVWTDRVAPRLADFRAGGDRRRAFIAYWRREGLLDLGAFACHKLFSILPLGWTSAFGGFIGRRIASRLFPAANERARALFRSFHPEWAAARVEQALVAHYENIGRVWIEFSSLPRMLAAGWIAHENIDVLLEARKAGPVILMACHLGNWEAGAALFHSFGMKWGIVFLPPASLAQAAIARKTRELFGVDFLPPGQAGALPMVRLLKQGGMVSIFCDEEVRGERMGPFFGEPPHLHGNMAIIARMRKMTGARIVFAYSARQANGRYLFRFAEIADLPSIGNPDAPLMDDVVALNAVVEPAVRAHCEQWYFLAHRVYRPETAA